MGFIQNGWNRIRGLFGSQPKQAADGFAPVLHLPINKQGRDFVVGDIHGTYSLLEKALTEVEFNPAVDRVISVGDLINKGTQSEKALHYLAQPWFYAVRGNHEKYLLDYCAEKPAQPRKTLAWVMNAPPETVQALAGIFNKLPYAIDIETPKGLVGVVHAEVPASLSWPEFVSALESGNPAIREKALFSKKRLEDADQSAIPGLYRAFFGHMIQKNGAREFGNRFYIDTGAVKRGVDINAPSKFHLTFVDVAASGKDIRHAHKTDAPVAIALQNPGKHGLF